MQPEFWFAPEIAPEIACSPLLVPDRTEADLVYVPLKILWTVCGHKDIT